MKHPDEKCNVYQAEFLAACKPEERRLHELTFMVGNATVHYHRKAAKFGLTEKDWEEWIEGLDEPMKSHHRKEGFEVCKGVLNFTRYIMEKNDIGLDAFLETHLSKNDLADYKNLID